MTKYYPTRAIGYCTFFGHCQGLGFALLAAFGNKSGRAGAHLTAKSRSPERRFCLGTGQTENLAI